MALATGSLSLLADAAHELSTVVAIAISLIAIRLAGRPATPTRTFGLLRGEALAALLNGALLVRMAVFILARGIRRHSNPVEMEAAPMLAMALGGISLDIACIAIMFRGQKADLNIRVYESDTWAGLVFAIVLLWAAYGIVRDALRILADSVPPGTDMEAVREELLGIAGVVATHHLHVRTVTGSVRTFSGHLVVTAVADPDAVLAPPKGSSTMATGSRSRRSKLNGKGPTRTICRYWSTKAGSIPMTLPLGVPGHQVGDSRLIGGLSRRALWGRRVL